jgi:thioredoxin:protein disulfide reductase
MPGVSRFFIMVCVCFVSMSQAFSNTLSAFPASSPFEPQASLPVDQAFRIDAVQEGARVHFSLNIAPNHMLYRHKLRFFGDDVQLNDFSLPQGVPYHDPVFGEVEVYQQFTSITVPIRSATQNATLRLSYQGCTKRLCYPPQEYQITLASVTGPERPIDDVPQEAPTMAHTSALTLLAFLAIGLGMALTPCVFPMYPILSSILMGEGAPKTAARTLWLAFAYVQGMAIVYSLLGVVVALAGLQFQVAMQHPGVMIAVSGLFVIFAGSMFGLFTLQPPSSYQTAINQASNRQQRGSVIGALGMGALAGLVASPCTTAPLAGVLMYIANTGDVLQGFLSLYALSLGMGIPLMLFALTGGKLMNKLRPYMDIVKNLFGFALLAMALYFASRVLDTMTVQYLTYFLGLLVCTYFSNEAAKAPHSFAKSGVTTLSMVGIICFTLLGLKAAGFFSEVNTSAHKVANTVKHNGFITVDSDEALARELNIAQRAGKAVMIDMYADWCTACIQYENHTFVDPKVKAELNNLHLIKVDMSRNSDFNKRVQDNMRVLGLPTLVLLDPQGRELTEGRITGYLDPDQFLTRIQGLGV